MSSTDRRGRRSRGGSYVPAAGVLLSVLPLVLLGLTTASSASGSPEPDAGAVRDVERVGGRAYLTGPPPGHTGGFGEPDCTACHFDAPVNPEGGELRVDGLPDRYAPGETYDLRVVLEAEDLERGGFQLSARFEEGDRLGRMAGDLTVPEATVQVVWGEPEGTGDPDVLYAEHTEEGSGEAARLSTERYGWTVRWHAPDVESGPVLFHAAANAANDDASEFGDRIFTLEVRVDPPECG